MAPWPGGGGKARGAWSQGGMEIVKVVGGGGARFEMLSGKFYGLSEKNFRFAGKALPLPLPLKHWSHGATGAP